MAFLFWAFISKSPFTVKLFPAVVILSVALLLVLLPTLRLLHVKILSTVTVIPLLMMISSPAVGLPAGLQMEALLQLPVMVAVLVAAKPNVQLNSSTKQASSFTVFVGVVNNFGSTSINFRTVLQAVQVKKYSGENNF